MNRRISGGESVRLAPRPVVIRELDRLVRENVRLRVGFWLTQAAFWLFMLRHFGVV